MHTHIFIALLSDPLPPIGSFLGHEIVFFFNESLILDCFDFQCIVEESASLHEPDSKPEFSALSDPYCSLSYLILSFTDFPKWFEKKVRNNETKITLLLIVLFSWAQPLIFSFLLRARIPG